MASGVNVLRYSALIAGVGYGFYHQSGINASLKAKNIDSEYQRQAGLIRKAKAEWARKMSPGGGEGNGVISDPSDPKFDLEAFVTMKMTESQQH